MPLIDDVAQIVARLRARGWTALFNQHGCDLAAADLATELRKELVVDRTLPGFEDFSPDGVRAIEPGDPARSLLYHALASPLVHPPATGGIAPAVDAYPTLEELDTVENYIYAVAERRLEDFPDAFVAVFAYQYRAGGRSPHGQFADLAFSRTGVARVGTAPPHYDPARRSFRLVPPEDDDALAVMPARYAAFLAIRRQPQPSDVILDRKLSDDGRTFLFPVHKLFPGDECLRDPGAALTVQFLEYHRNEKLRRIHSHGGIPVLPGFRIDEAPFVRDSRNATDLAGLQRVGASALVTPREHPQLLRTATQRNSQTGRREVVRFVVPAANNTNRFWTSYQISAGQRTGRAAPEYVNIRHRVARNAAGQLRVTDMSRLPEAQFAGLLQAGGYEAAHFIDDTCDGCIIARLGGLPVPIPGDRHRAAYSLVAAPDFFPRADQVTIARWMLARGQDQFRQGGPAPLSDGRFVANPGLALPDVPNTSAFSRADDTVSAIVAATSLDQLPPRPPRATLESDASTSFLPDAASNVFAPGWDVSLSSDFTGEFYAAYGLGSPFPEDAKLCAALNSFWPAVAPDATRTFGLRRPPTAMPMLDSELGHHPDHPAVAGGGAQSRPGWDGEFGPFFERRDGELFVNFASRDRSDYTANGRAGLIRASDLAEVSAAELIRRMEALRACVRVLPPAGDAVRSTTLFLVSAEAIPDWGARGDKGDARLQGPGYLYVFALLGGPETEPASGDLRRRQLTVQKDPAGEELTFTCQIAGGDLCVRQAALPFRFVPNA
jgi:hypothetical protein